MATTKPDISGYEMATGFQLLSKNTPLDNRTLFQSRATLLNCDENLLPNGIIATYINGNGLDAEGNETGLTECFQWFEHNPDIATYHRWRKLETTKAADLFKLCTIKEWYNPDNATLGGYNKQGPIDKQSSIPIYLAPDVDTTTYQQNVVQSGNGLAVWKQYAWNVAEQKWEFIGNINLTVNTDGFATTDDLSSYATSSDLNAEIAARQQGDQDIRDYIGTLADLQSGFNAGNGNNPTGETIEFEVVVSAASGSGSSNPG